MISNICQKNNKLKEDLNTKENRIKELISDKEAYDKSITKLRNIIKIKYNFILIIFLYQ